MKQTGTGLHRDQARIFSAVVEKRKKRKQGESKANSWIESSSCTSKKKEMRLVKSEETQLPKDEEKPADTSEESLFQESHTHTL